MTFALIGGSGMLGSDIAFQLQLLNYPFKSFSSATLDIQDPLQIDAQLDAISELSWVINCAAYTKVDDCETYSQKAFSVNSEGVQNLANYCKKRGVRLVHFSTDYVFDGLKEFPYVETDLPNPLSVYGKSKLAGEEAIQATLKEFYIFRVQWLYGQNGPHFMKTIAKLAQTNPILKVVNDQWGSPTWTRDVALAVISAIKEAIPFGLYHLPAGGFTTWYDVSRLLITTLNLNANITPVLTAEFPRPAKRPLNGRLSREKFDRYSVFKFSSWNESVGEFLAQCPIV